MRCSPDRATGETPDRPIRRARDRSTLTRSDGVSRIAERLACSVDVDRVEEPIDRRPSLIEVVQARPGIHDELQVLLDHGARCGLFGLDATRPHEGQLETEAVGRTELGGSQSGSVDFRKLR